VGSVLLDSLLGDDDSALPSASPPLARLRGAAAAELRRTGLPGPRDERWKYTSLRALEQRRYVDGDCGAAYRVVDPMVCRLPGIDGSRLVFVNGVFRQDLSDLRASSGLTVTRLGADPQGLADVLADVRATPAASNAFALLNTALATDGVLLRVAAGAQVTEPLHLVCVGAAADADIAWQLRLRVELGDGGALSMVEHHVAAGAHAHLGNVVADYRLSDGARLDLVQLQDAAQGAALVRRSDMQLGREARLHMHTVELGAQFMRHELDIALAGRGARFESRGVFALRGRQHADTRMQVVHEARDTECDITWRGVADQRSRGVFHGAITVAAGADGADARLSNKNLLLSPQAEIDTQPVLEIHADEVKAAHGATVGQLDERALFYLRSRGLPLDLARRMLVSAFCSAVLVELEPPDLRARVDALLAARLPQAEDAP
jgi:Fe-S cluster assembly protein SufD